MSSKKKKRIVSQAKTKPRSTFATSPVSAVAELLAAALDRFLVFGIFTNLAIIKDKIIKMFSLLRVNYLTEVSQMIRHFIISRNKLLGRY